MRIISGNCRGRKLVQLEGENIRPTSDRTREAIFNMLGPRVRNARVLDLFAGSGALGIEALSRGASQAVFIDLSCDIVRQNLSLCRLSDEARVFKADLIKGPWPNAVFESKYDIVFMDPPYHQGHIDHVLSQDGFFDLLNEDALVIAEYSHKENPDFSIPGLDILKQKKYSKTRIAVLTKT